MRTHSWTLGIGCFRIIFTLQLLPRDVVIAADNEGNHHQLRGRRRSRLRRHPTSAVVFDNNSSSLPNTGTIVVNRTTNDDALASPVHFGISMDGNDATQQIVGGDEANDAEYPYFDYRGYTGVVGAYFRGDDSTEGAKTVDIVEWAPHPYFDDVSLKNDVALMKIYPPVYQTTDITLELAEADDIQQGESLTVMGLGLLGQDAEDDGVLTLRDVTVEAIPTATCNDPDWYDGEVDYTMFCAGYPEGQRDACQGDSGSPLVRKIGNKHVQVGIVSWGDGCGNPQRPGVYTRVHRAFRWIKHVGCTQWDSPSAFCRGGNGGVVVDGSSNTVISCESNEKEIDFTLRTGDTGGDIRWKIVSIQQQKTVLSQVGLDDWETYHTRKCLPQSSSYFLLIKNFKGTGLSGGGYSLTVDGKLVEESYDNNDSFRLKVITF